MHLKKPVSRELSCSQTHKKKLIARKGKVKKILNVYYVTDTVLVTSDKLIYLIFKTTFLLFPLADKEIEAQRGKIPKSHS